MRTEALTYELPERLIAAEPLEPRDAARLMVVDRSTGKVEHMLVSDLGAPDGHLHRGDLMVFNQTRVMPARFGGRRCSTDGRVSGLFLQTDGPTDWQVLLEARGSMRSGEQIEIGEGSVEARLELVEPLGSGRWRARLHSNLETFALLDRIGTAPLPPYIQRARRRLGHPPVATHDQRRYNSVFATDPGSVAAPTASLHFTEDLIHQIDQLGILRVHLTLHIGLGTFAPVRTALLEEHRMHSESVHIPASTLAALAAARAVSGRIIAVGTTCVRAMESLPQPLPERDFCSETNLFITPNPLHDFPFRFTDALLTNFHLPRSTLLALVAALPGVGLDRLLGWYRLAIEHGYRFYSYGDAMLLL